MTGINLKRGRFRGQIRLFALELHVVSFERRNIAGRKYIFKAGYEGSAGTAPATRHPLPPSPRSFDF